MPGDHLCRKPEQNQGPIGALLQRCSVLLCLTPSLAGNGEGLGTLGLHEPKLRELGTEAGFSIVRRIPMDNPFNSLYELTPLDVLQKRGRQLMQLTENKATFWNSV